MFLLVAKHNCIFCGSAYRKQSDVLPLRVSNGPNEVCKFALQKSGAENENKDKGESQWNRRTRNAKVGKQERVQLERGKTAIQKLLAKTFEAKTRYPVTNPEGKELKLFPMDEDYVHYLFESFITDMVTWVFFFRFYPLSLVLNQFSKSLKGYYHFSGTKIMHD